MDGVRKAINEGGLSTLLYRACRYALIQLLPPDTVKYNGVEVKEGKKLSFLIPGDGFSGRPGYEKGIIDSFNRTLNQGDKVVIIGGGYGVTAITAKQIVGEEGEVVVYEPAKEMVARVEETSRLNDTPIDETNHAAVGELKNPWGDTSSCKTVSVTEIPECDTLELDCEGTELEILENLQIGPQRLIVESHGVFDAPTREVEEKISDLGYEILDKQLAEDNETCREDDIKVITASKGEG